VLHGDHAPASAGAQGAASGFRGLYHTKRLKQPRQGCKG
jgi:hypothetical protein